ncbi:MAG TPA: dipeptidase PepE [Microthrixaceae bacterium]|nr:dipeptidase PepE [Microthrixaceae bacterium]
MTDLLLMSNSTAYRGAMFAHAGAALREVAAGDVVTFVPFARDDWDGYFDVVSAALGAIGIDVVSAHRCAEPDRAIADAQVLMMGGGNTFRLLAALHRLGIMEVVRDRVREGATRYMGASAGTNVACPTIRTTNDMPICLPPTFSALGLLPFQINPHYFDVDPDSIFMGETRDERLVEFLEHNDCPVLALYEGSWLRVSNGSATLSGPARLFDRSGVRPFETGADLSHLLRVIPSFDTRSSPRGRETG